MSSVYPAQDRSVWILAQRSARPTAPDPFRAHGVFLEEERLASGAVVSSGVILLTNKECPWRCLMCDLWKDTTTQSVPRGAIPQQIEAAQRSWADAGVRPRQVKLYNSGSFFDSAAIPPEDYPDIARLVSDAENVVIECHPKLVGARLRRFREFHRGPLEVALGLETAHPEILEKLNKQFDLAEFSRAAAFLRAEGVALRVFLLVNPPFLGETEGLDWVVKSADFAFAQGATAVSLIPTRGGNGAMERLRASGEFVPPTLATLETAVDRVLALRSGRVLADTWGLEPFSQCPQCFAARRDRLARITLAQEAIAPVFCAACAQP